MSLSHIRKFSRFGPRIRWQFSALESEHVTFFGLNLVRTGSHFNRLVRTKASDLLRSDTECHRLHDSDLLRRLFETVLKRCIDEGYRTAALAEWR